MASVLSAADYVIFALSLGICAIVGVYYVVVERLQRSGSSTSKWALHLLSIIQMKRKAASKKQAAMQRDASSATVTTTEYFLGNRQMSLVPTVCSLFASYFSSIGMLGIPADIYKYGSAAIFGLLAYIPAAIFNAFVFVPIYYRNNFSCTFEYIEKRYESVLLRKITTSLSAVSSIAYAAVCAYIPCVAFEQATGVPEWILIIATGLITIFYTAAGGLKAVVLVDTIQAGIMFAGIIAVLVAGAIQVGGFDVAWQIASERGRIAVYDWSASLLRSHSIWGLTIGSTFYFAAATNNQALLQRCCSLESQPKAILSLVLSTPLVGLLSLILWLTTIIAFAYFSEVVNCDPLSSKFIKSINQIMSYYVTVVMNYPGFLGLYYACLFSGSLSSMSTCYNMVSSLLWEDWLKDWLEPKLTRRQIAFVIKLLATLTGVITSLLALSCKYVGGTALKMVTCFVSTFSGTIFAAFLAAAFLPFVTSASMIVALLIGVPFVLWIILSQIIYKLGDYPPLPVYGRDCSLTAATSINSSPAFGWDGNSNPMMVQTLSPATIYSTAVASPADSLPPGLRNLYSLSYNYFTILCVIICLGIAIIFSLITRLLGKYYFPNVEWLQSPRKVNPSYLVFSWNSKNTSDVVEDEDHGGNGNKKNSNNRNCVFQFGDDELACDDNINNNKSMPMNDLSYINNAYNNYCSNSVYDSPNSLNIRDTMNEISPTSSAATFYGNNGRYCENNVGQFDVGDAGSNNNNRIITPTAPPYFAEPTGRLTSYV